MRFKESLIFIESKLSIMAKAMRFLQSFEDFDNYTLTTTKSCTYLLLICSEIQPKSFENPTVTLSVICLGSIDDNVN